MPRIELVSVSALRPALHNPREADAERLDLVKLSLRKLGFLLPLVASPDGEILSGHQRHTVAVDMGVSRVPVLRVEVPEARRRGLNILFNRATNDIPCRIPSRTWRRPCAVLTCEPWRTRFRTSPRTVRPSSLYGR